MTNTLRTTFGIIDPLTGEKYTDIINAFIVRDTLHYDRDRQPVYIHNNKAYALVCDSKLTKFLQYVGHTDVIISIQERTNVYVAIARMPKLEDLPVETRTLLLKQGILDATKT